MPRKKSSQEPQYDELPELQSTSEKKKDKNTEQVSSTEAETAAEAEQTSSGLSPWKMLLQNSFQYRKTLKRMSLLWLTLQKLCRRNGQKVSTIQIRIGWRKVLTEIQRFPLVCSPVIQILQPSILQKRSSGRYLRQVIWQKAWIPLQQISCC